MYIKNYVCRSVTAALFTTLKDCKTPNSPSTEDLLNNHPDPYDSISHS